MGGKQKLALHIAGKIDGIQHKCYAEPFCGMASVFFRRERRPSSELLNDINGDVVNLFRVVKEHQDEFLRLLDWMLASRKDYDRLVDTPPETMTDIQRAARFLYMQNMKFGGKVFGNTGINFGPHSMHPFRRDRMAEKVRAGHERLQGVTIENLHWDQFIERYDRSFTLFYIDPPYWGHTKDYGKGLFSEEDIRRMAELLRSIKGRFILSLNDREEVRDVFSGFRIEGIMARWSLNPKRERVGEVLISNVDLEGLEAP
ncbi:MAG: DNA adenine methylase [Gammaproteobacteria bacterium]|nr:DNA adenine methylase [Gammaproteobacteria bacterium]